MYDSLISENHKAKIILINKTLVLIRFDFSNMRFIYAWGPFHKAKPVMAAIIAIVKIRTNLAGAVTMENTLTRATNKRRRQIPNAPIAFM